LFRYSLKAHEQNLQFARR